MIKSRSIIILKEKQVKQLVDILITELNGKHNKIEKQNQKHNENKRHNYMKDKGSLLAMEQFLFLYGDKAIKKKIEYVKNFLKEYFQIEDFEDAYVEIDRLHSKSLLWLLLFLIIDFESKNKKPNDYYKH